jgi:hypothetical protein
MSFEPTHASSRYWMKFSKRNEGDDSDFCQVLMRQRKVDDVPGGVMQRTVVKFTAKVYVPRDPLNTRPQKESL